MTNLGIGSRMHSCATLLAMAALLAFAPAIEAQQGTLSGRVVSSDNGSAISAAAVRIVGDSRWASTGEDGSYTLTLPTGTHSVRVEALGYRTLVAEVTITSGANSQDFRLDTRPLALEGIQVSTLRPDLSPSSELQEREVQEANPKDAGELLRAIAGVEAVRRGPLGLDPVVRGLRETEVGTYLDGARMFPAGPARMDSPLTHLDPSAVRSMEVVKGPYALTWGPGNMSAIRVETQPLPDGPASARGSVAAGYDTNLGASETTGKVFGRADNGIGYFVHGAWREGGDYSAGDGSLVPGDFSSWEVRGRLGFEIGTGSHLSITGGYQDQGPLDYPGRLLTAEYFEASNVSLKYNLSRPDGLLRGLEVQTYRNDVDHGMNNSGKPTAMDMPGRMPPFALDVTVESAIEVKGSRVAADLDLGDGTSAEVGGDFMTTNRDADRTIARQSNGMVMFEDMMWPDATIDNLGGFGRLAWANESTHLAATVRVDGVKAEAPTASTFFLTNVTGDLISYETNLSAAATASFRVDTNWTLAFGLGSVVRSADANERYSDRIPASKAQMAAEFMGNPALEPERSTQGDIWLDGGFEGGAVHFGAFARRISNYITIAPTGLPRRLPLSPPTVFQYVNGEASFYGFEASATLALSDVLTADGSVSYLHGEDTELNEPAIGISPVQSSLGLRFEEPEGRFYLEGIGRLVGEQTSVSTSRGELPTDGYFKADLRAGYGLPNGVTLRAGVLNLFDEHYNDHLNAKNPFTGIPIPEPGRVIFIDAAWSF